MIPCIHKINLFLLLQKQHEAQANRCTTKGSCQAAEATGCPRATTAQSVVRSQQPGALRAAHNALFFSTTLAPRFSQVHIRSGGAKDQASARYDTTR
ncbi:hypothetical protein L596_019882 [Steinernema carpocapsae]|uniref:Uncharacterized protein n=1 Tax=Steinernema carpocapsae TaxID=34508 RepID=A0A4U5MS38_STECR|nr:hypothetical protein L596_019882 [Steinernema carpocapsae]